MCVLTFGINHLYLGNDLIMSCYSYQSLFFLYVFLGEIMTKVRMHFHQWNYCGGYEYWLNFKQGEHKCSIKKMPSSVKGVAEIWSSEGEVVTVLK